MPIEFNDLPLQYQRQAIKKLVDQMKRPASVEEKPAQSKYHNIKTERASIKFDSKKEAARYDELMLMQADGSIRDLRLQVEFTLQAAYTTIGGERIRAIRYLADFTYYRRQGDSWEFVVEDAKSRPTQTKTYIMKKKMMADRLGLTITEV